MLYSETNSGGSISASIAMFTPMNRVLVIEDESSIADSVCYALKNASIEACWASTASAGLAMFKHQPFQLVVLDVGLPDLDGFEVCRQIRLSSNVPVLFLTARSDEIDRVVGLELGADDYICKPFSPRELVARVKANLRRVQSFDMDDRLQASTNTHSAQALDENLKKPSLLEINVQTRMVRYFNIELDLTPYEFSTLSLLVSNPRRVYTREQILEHVWHEPEAILDRVVDTHIKTLRAKLKSANPDVSPIKTHRGVGYSWEPL